MKDLSEEDIVNGLSMIYDFLDHRERVLDDESIEPPTGMQILGLLDSLEIAAYDLMDSFSEGFDEVSNTVSKEPQCARFGRIFTCWFNT